MGAGGYGYRFLLVQVVVDAGVSGGVQVVDMLLVMGAGSIDCMWFWV